MSCDGESGTEKLVWNPLVVLVFDAVVLALVMVTICTLKPALLLELLDGAELLADGAGELIEARRNETRAVEIDSLGLGVGVGATAWLITF